jgi:WD40 repeat protein
VGHTSHVQSAAFSPDSTKVVTASWDGTAKIWNAATGGIECDLAKHIKSVRSAEFSPDGIMVVTGSGDNTAKIWQLLPRSLPGVNDVDAALFIHLLYWAHTHNQRITDTAWAPKVLHTIEWNRIKPADKKLLQGWIGAAGIR